MSGPVRLAVLGDPLSYTRSPDLHRAGLDALGLAGESQALRTPIAELGARLQTLATAGYRGVNLTHPLKEPALALLDPVSAGALRARSVNTVRFDPESWKSVGSWRPGAMSGDTTDGPGFVDWLATLGRDPARERVVLFGAGGAARSVGLALVTAGANVTAVARMPATTADAWRPLAPARLVGWTSEEIARALEGATLVANATPLSGAAAPLAPASLPAGALVVDFTYGEELTPWVQAARALGRDAHDGLGMLVGQARRSFGMWFGQEPPFATLARAVGWPR